MKVLFKAGSMFSSLAWPSLVQFWHCEHRHWYCQIWLKLITITDYWQTIFQKECVQLYTVRTCAFVETHAVKFEHEKYSMNHVPYGGYSSPAGVRASSIQRSKRGSTSSLPRQTSRQMQCSHGTRNNSLERRKKILSRGPCMIVSKDWKCP